MEVTIFEPPELMVTTTADPDLLFAGTWTYEVAPADTGCVVMLTEDGRVSHPIMRFMSRFVLGCHATMETYLTDLSQELGESVVIERVR